jgi:hypothetical protein
MIKSFECSCLSMLKNMRLCESKINWSRNQENLYVTTDFFVRLHESDEGWQAAPKKLSSGVDNWYLDDFFEQTI